MQADSMDARRRADFFRQLAAQGTGAGQWDQMFQLLQKGQDAARRAQLDELEAQFRDGRAELVNALRGSGLFRDWELELIQLGMATANLRAIYLRLAEHYDYVQRLRTALIRHLWLPLGLVLGAAVVLPVAGYLDHLIGWPGVLALMLLPLPLLALLWWLGRRLLGGVLRETPAPGRVDRWYRLPGIGRLLALYQTYQYFANLSLCLDSGAGLPRALQLAAECLPYSPCQRQFLAVHEAVAGGGRLSDALRDSGLLTGVALKPMGQGANALDAQQLLTASLQAAFVARLDQWGRWLPQLGLLLVPLLVAVNLWVMF